MAQTGFTPISNYYSATATNVPTAGNLVAGELAINTADGKLFYKDSSGVVQTIATKAAAALGTSTTGSGATVLATSPTLVTPALGTPSAINLTNATALPSSALPAGTVLQVVSTTKTDRFYTTSTSFVDVTGLTVSITPKFATSKILVCVGVTTAGGVTNIVTQYTRLYRDSTVLTDWRIGAPAADQSGTIAINYLDSPATTSSVTYKIQIRGDGAGVGINTTQNGVVQDTGDSTITLMEIAG